MLDRLTLEPERWPTSAVLDWVDVLQRVPLRNAAARRDAALGILRARLDFQGTVLSFSTERRDALWWLMVSTDSNAARLLLAVLDRPEWRDDVPRLVRGLVARQSRGHWDTTVANAWGTLALERFSAAFETTAVAGRTSVVLGTTMGEAHLLEEQQQRWFLGGTDAIEANLLPRYGTTLLPIHVARALGARGLVQAIPTACAAGNYAIAYAADLIRAGRADVVVTGAAELLERLQFAGFVRIGAMSPDRSRPFDADRKGLLLGEGAATLVLESARHAEARGAAPLAEVGGCGLACDGFHITRPDADGRRIADSMREAIATSGLRPGDVDHVNAHGTATAANDVIESRAINDVFGAHRPAVTSIKSMLGHSMGAAAALEAVACVLSLDDGVIPPTIHLDHQDPECDIDVVANAPREVPLEVVLNNAIAFGGQECAVIFAKPGRLPESADPPGVARASREAAR